MDENEVKIRKYESSLNLLFYEGQIAWQLNVVFIALNVGLASLMAEPLKTAFNSFNGMLLFYGCVGLVINILWYGTFQRNNKYYNFRMAQARSIEPNDWKFLNDRGLRFSKGEKIIIDGAGLSTDEKEHKLNNFESLVSNKRALKTVILLISFIYLILIVLSLHFITVYNF